MKFYESSKLLALLFTGAITLTACGDDNEGTEPNPNPPVQPETPDKGEALNQAQQKERLDKVAMKFMQLTPAADFQAMADLMHHIDATYNDEVYQWNAVERWGRDVWNSLKKSLGTSEQREEVSGSSDYQYIYREIYNNYSAIILASNFTGHFTAQGGKWVYAKANDLQFSFTDQSGQPCTLSIATSGNIKKVYAVDLDDWKDYTYESTPNGSISTEYYDRVKCTIGVPDHIVMKLTQGGSEVVKTQVDIDLNSIQGEQFDISKSGLNLKANVALNNGYVVNVDRAVYGGNDKEAAVSGTIKKGTTSLATFAVSTTLSGIPSCNLDAFTAEGFGDANTDNIMGKNAFVKLDVLGEVQIQGQVSDIRKLADYLEMADDNDDNESQFKSYLNQANSLMKLHLFYDNKATKQADVTFEPFLEDDPYVSYWYCEPVLKFYDGSSFSTFEAFFNDTDFKNVIDAFDKLMQDFDNML